MTLAEYFSFLPYGKYAFYIWFSYLTTLIVIATLFIRTRSIHKNAIKQLRIKYLREG
ncbi:heme exporter protein CcmD [Isorropodon fossajaponicum symbiont]|uniref:heme exporter protein CcmD n=1 Tax=Isorropodon fossajaponicum symbiont TaxID=883811 RepID=UPI001914DF42|nr:heme exporter protein CcmD [Isorropodon fossajaponicum symbiont]